MTPWQREMIFLIADDRFDALQYLHFIFNLKHCNEMFTWLFSNNIRGIRFMEYVALCGYSHLKLGAQLTARIEKEKITRPLFVQRDLKPQ